MKKYLVKDTDEGFEVNELDEETTETIETEEVKDDAVLTADEITALKSLAAVSADLIKLIEEKKESVEDDDDEEERLEDEDEDDESLSDEDEDDEKVVDTDCMKSHDSKRSIGAIARKSKKHDSIDEANDIESAWTKRYGG